MTPGDPEVDELLAPLRDGPVALSGTADAAAQRMRLLPGVRQAVRDVPVRRERSRRRVAMLWSGTAIAAAALLGVGLARSAEQASGEGAIASLRPPAGELRIDPLGSESAAWIDASGTRRPIHASSALEGSGELVAAASSWSRLSTPQGVRVELAPRTRLRVHGAARSLVGAQLNLVEGEVQCQVPKLGASAHFAIETADARVIVHGTRFSVHVGTPDHPGTCVRVTEGLVEVRHGETRTMLPRGTQWGCEPPPATRASALAQVVTVPAQTQLAAQRTDGGSAPLASARPARERARRLARAARGAARAAIVAAVPASAKITSAKNASETVAQSGEQASRLAGTLGEENRLLGAALSAERGGDRERARELFQQLVARNPISPLAPEARTGLVRVR